MACSLLRRSDSEVPKDALKSARNPWLLQSILSVKAQCAILIFGEWCHPVLNIFVPQDGQALIKGDIRYGLDAREGSLPYRIPVEVLPV